MMTLDNRHKLAAPYWARPRLRTVTDPDGGGGSDDDDDDDDDDDADDDEDEDDDPDAGKSEDELRAELAAVRVALSKANGSSAKRRKREAALKAELAKVKGAKPAADGDEPATLDAEAIKAEAQAAADQRVARAEARSRLRSLGLDDAKVTRALKLIDLSDVLVEGDDVDGIDDALDALREDVPELFVKPTRKRRAVSGDSDRAGKTTSKPKSASAQQAAALLGRGR